MTYSVINSNIRFHISCNFKNVALVQDCIYTKWLLQIDAISHQVTQTEYSTYHIVKVTMLTLTEIWIGSWIYNHLWPSANKYETNLNHIFFTILILKLYYLASIQACDKYTTKCWMAHSVNNEIVLDYLISTFKNWYKTLESININSSIIYRNNHIGASALQSYGKQYVKLHIMGSISKSLGLRHNWTGYSF